MVGDYAIGVQKIGRERIAIKIEHKQSELIERNAHGGMIEGTAADLAGTARDDVDSALVLDGAGRCFAIRPAIFDPSVSGIDEHSGIKRARKTIMPVNEVRSFVSVAVA